VDYADHLPRYGAVGSFGLCGLEERAEFGELRPVAEAYGFEPGRIYNLESSRIIREDQGMFVGAHSDFAHPEVGHAVWSAILAGSNTP
jgi:hypothetical protein